MSTTFAYQVVTSSGQRLRGVEASPNAALLAQTLEARGLIVLDVAATQTAVISSGTRWGRQREVLEVTRALAALLPAGLPLARALAAASHIASGEVRATVDALRARVERGEPLAQAMAEYPRLFSPLYLGLVRAGERSGSLERTFARLADQLEHDEQFRARLLSLSIYPLLLASAGGVAVLILLFFVIPRFAELLATTGISLPRSTRLLLATADGLKTHWPVVVGAGLGLVGLTAWLRVTPAGRRAAGQLSLSVPLVRSFRQHALGARFARLTSTLVHGGAPLLAALDDTVESIGDPMARDEVIRIRDRVREGASLRDCVQQSTLFPPLLAQLVAVGEESGRLAEFLAKSADILEQRTTRVLERLVAAAEPAMIVVFGGVVGFVALSLLQAIYSVNAGAMR